METIHYTFWRKPNKKSTCLLTDRVSICQTFRSIFFLRPLHFPGKGTLLTLAFVHRSKAKELSLSTKTWTLDKTCEKESSMYTSSGLYQRSQQRSALRPQRLTPRNRRHAAPRPPRATPLHPRPTAAPSGDAAPATPVADKDSGGSTAASGIPLTATNSGEKGEWNAHKTQYCCTVVDSNLQLRTSQNYHFTVVLTRPESVWDNPYLNRKVCLFYCQIFT